MSLITIVVPVYNNSASIMDLFDSIAKVAEKNIPDQFEFIFVDDGSYDDSLSILLLLAKKYTKVRVVKLSRNFGSNAALMAGLSQSRGDAVVAIAADFQDPPELIHTMLDRWRNGSKVVLAARQTRDDGFFTRLLADTFYKLFKLFAIKTMPKRGFDFFLIDREICDHINAIQENNVYLMGLILWLGFSPDVVYYHRRKREKQYGRSMWTFARRFKYFIDSFVAFSYFPIRASSVIGILLSSLGLIYAIIVIILRLFFSFEAEGWASLMVVMLIVSGGQMLMLGILGEYLWRNLDETRKRPPYIVEKIIEGSGSE